MRKGEGLGPAWSEGRRSGKWGVEGAELVMEQRLLPQRTGSQLSRLAAGSKCVSSSAAAPPSGPLVLRLHFPYPLGWLGPPKGPAFSLFWSQALDSVGLSEGTEITVPSGKGLEIATSGEVKRDRWG